MITLATLALAPTILGITLGKPLPMPSCDAPGMQPGLGQTCWSKQPGPAGSERRQIFTPVGQEGPSFVRGWISVETIDDQVVAIIIPTTGVNSQSAAMAELRRKFGAPSRVASDHLQNLMGAHFVGERAWWKRPGYTVSFDSTESDINFGLIKVTTPQYDAIDAQRHKELPL
jgi:hypothetical protein